MSRDRSATGPPAVGRFTRRQSLAVTKRPLDPVVGREAQAWIEAVTGARRGGGHRVSGTASRRAARAGEAFAGKDFQDSLTNGVLLCKYVPVAGFASVSRLALRVSATAGIICIFRVQAHQHDKAGVCQDR